jgi:hypothetical protein
LEEADRVQGVGGLEDLLGLDDVPDDVLELLHLVGVLDVDDEQKKGL